MKILMLVNWKVEYRRIQVGSEAKQPPDYYVSGEPYWFFRYFHLPHEVEVIDIRSFPWLEKFEQEKIRFYIWQALRAIPKLKQYDLIISHGMPSGVVLSLFRRFFPTRAKHIVFEIGSFNSAATKGMALKLMQFASKSINGFIYHTSSQLDYYREYFPWIVEKTQFIHYGADTSFFSPKKGSKKRENNNMEKKVILCIGYRKRDWNTLLEAYRLLQSKHPDRKKQICLRLIGKDDVKIRDASIMAVPYIPVAELKKEIEKAAVCVVPLEDFNYSFGQMTLLQQMAMEKPVIVARVASTVDYVEEGETALFYAPGKAEDLCRKLELLLEDEKLASRLAEKAAASVKDRFSEERMAVQIEKFIDRVLSQSEG